MQRRIITDSPTGAADKLGLDLTTMYRWLKAKRIASIKEGKRWKVFLVEVIQDSSEPMHFSLPYEMLPHLLGEELAAVKE